MENEDEKWVEKWSEDEKQSTCCFSSSLRFCVIFNPIFELIFMKNEIGKRNEKWWKIATVSYPIDIQHRSPEAPPPWSASFNSMVWTSRISSCANPKIFKMVNHAILQPSTTFYEIFDSWSQCQFLSTSPFTLTSSDCLILVCLPFELFLLSFRFLASTFVDIGPFHQHWISIWSNEPTKVDLSFIPSFMRQSSLNTIGPTSSMEQYTLAWIPFPY